MKFTFPLFSMLILLPTGFVIAEASSSVRRDDNQQLTFETLALGENPSPGSGSVRRRLGNRNRQHQSLFVEKSAETEPMATASAKADPCNAYDPSSNERYLCKQLGACVSAKNNGNDANANSGNAIGVEKNICETIQEIDDPVVVADVVETAGVYDGILTLADGNAKNCIISAYEMLPSSSPSNVPTGMPSSSPSELPSYAPTVVPSLHPSSSPSDSPSGTPTLYPSSSPTSDPSALPSKMPSSTPTTSVDPRCAPLVALYEATGGDSWTTNTGWPGSASPKDDCCQWYGVRCVCPNALGRVACDTGGLVDTVVLSNNNLIGTIPTQIGAMKDLNQFILENNVGLTGSIPTEIGDCAYLSNLSLGGFTVGTNIGGTIPTEIGSLTRLRLLYLWNTELTGTIPTEIGKLNRLSGIFLNGNQFVKMSKISGSIPTEIGLLHNLQQFMLNDSQISGTLPTQMGSMKHLRQIHLYNTMVSGGLPSSIGNLQHLYDFQLQNTHISGPLPEEIGNCAKLQTFRLGRTTRGEMSITGTIPSSFGQLKELIFFDVEDGSLGGGFPDAFCDLFDDGKLSAITVSSYPWRSVIRRSDPDAVAECKCAEFPYASSQRCLPS